MTIAKRTPIFQCLLLAGVISLTACGGGGGGKKQPPIDTTPNAISLAASTNVEPGTVVTSAPVTITGINTAAPVSIVGGEYSISGGAFTANPGSIINGQTLTLRITASDKTNTPKEAVVTVGGVSAKFTVTTVQDVTPDAFTFAPKNDAQLNAEYTSDTITVSGIDIAVPVSIAGGLYSINGGDFTSAAGTVSAGQTITVKTTAAAKTETAQNAVVTIGGVNGTFTVTTIQDSFAPVADFKFPTPYTMSEAMSVKVRGTATDDNAITNVKVVVRSYKLETPTVTLSTTEINATPKAEANGIKDFSSWTVDVPLTALAENEIKVVATDVRNNSIAVDSANKVVIRQADVSSAFPDKVNEFKSLKSELLIDNFDGRHRVLVVDGNVVWSVDPGTGKRTAFFTESCRLNTWDIDPILKHIFAICSGRELREYALDNGQMVATYDPDFNNASSIRGVAVDRNNGRAKLIMVEAGGEVAGNNGRITAFSLDKKIFSEVTTFSQGPDIQVNESVIVHGDEYLVPGGRFDSNFGGQIISVNALTGARKVISDNSIGIGDEYSGYFDEVRTAHLVSAVIDSETNNLIAFEFWTNKIFSINLGTFDRKVISNVSWADNQEIEVRSSSLKIDDRAAVLYMVDENRNAILLVDIRTGDKVILSKSDS